MAVRQMGLDVRPYLPHSIAATLGVVALPAAAIFGLLFFFDPDPNVLVTSAISIALTGAATTLGASLWMRQERSSELSFGDLMLWSWYRRKRAEDRLMKSTSLLGLDRAGNPRETPAISRARQLRILHEMNEALEAKDPYTRGHAGRVERHVFRTGAAMGLSVKDLDDLRLAAALHDVGKIRVPDSVLRKEGPLTDAERDVMNEHPAVGAWMVSHVGTQDVIEAIRYHHERWDGRGYPDGLAGTDIPLFARIISVADTYDAITSTRSYRVKAESGKALAIIKAEAGKQLDPLCVDAFVKALPHKVPVSALLFLTPSAFREGARQVALLFTRQGLASITAGAAAAGAAAGIGSVAVKPLASLPVTKPAAIVRSVPVPKTGVVSRTASSDLVRVGRRSVAPKLRESRAGRGDRKVEDRLDRAFRSQVRGGGREPGADVAIAAPVDEVAVIEPVIDNDSGRDNDNDDDGGSNSGPSNSGSSGSGSEGTSSNSGSGSGDDSKDSSGNSGSGKDDSRSRGGGSGSSNGSGNSGSKSDKSGSISSGKGSDKEKGNGKGGGKTAPGPSPQTPPDNTDTGSDTGSGSTDGTGNGTTDGDSSGDSGSSAGGGSSDGGNGNGNGNSGNSGGSGNGNSGSSGGGGDSGGSGNSGSNGNGNGGDKDKGGPDT